MEYQTLSTMTKITCFCNTVFYKVAKFLMYISRKTGLSYNTVNIIVYYVIIPLLWGLLISKYICLGIILFWVILLSMRIKNLSDKMFKYSQKFIMLFGDYYIWSVIICVIVPIIITIILLVIKYKS